MQRPDASSGSVHRTVVITAACIRAPSRLSRLKFIIARHLGSPLRTRAAAPDDRKRRGGLIDSPTTLLSPRANYRPTRIRAMAKARSIVLAPAILALSLAQPARAQAPIKRFITPDGKRPSGLFANGVMVGKTLYIAGKGDYRAKEAFPGKVENCLNEIRKILQLAGLDMKHVVKSFVYLEDHEQFPEFNKHYAKFFPENPPARTTLGVPQVPGDSRVEITCIAYADLDETRRIGAPRPGLPFSPGVLAGDTLYVSGKGDQLPDGTHPATFEEQVRQSMRNVEATLKEAGMDLKNVVMSHVFLDKY